METFFYFGQCIRLSIYQNYSWEFNFYTFKSIRSLSTKVDLGVFALKQDFC